MSHHARIVGLSLVLCLPLAACRNGGQSPGGGLSAKSVLGQKAPELVVETWLTDEPDTEGKMVLVDFWATWCPPCRDSIPHLNELAGKFSDRLVVIGISDESAEEVRAMTSPKIDYAVGVDTGNTTGEELEIEGIPHAILIDPDGTVRWEGHPHSLQESELKALLDEHVKS